MTENRPYKYLRLRAVNNIHSVIYYQFKDFKVTQFFAENVVESWENNDMDK